MATSVTIGKRPVPEDQSTHEDHQATCPSHKAEDPASTAILLGKGHQKGRDQTKGERQ